MDHWAAWFLYNLPTDLSLVHENTAQDGLQSRIGTGILPLPLNSLFHICNSYLHFLYLYLLFLYSKPVDGFAVSAFVVCIHAC